IDPDRLCREYSEVVAVCGYCALKASGDPVHIPQIDRTRMPRALDFDDIRLLARSSTSKVVVVLAGAEKLDALLAVLNPGMVTTIVIAEGLAASLLERLHENPGSLRPRQSGPDALTGPVHDISPS